MLLDIRLFLITVSLWTSVYGQVSPRRLPAPARPNVNVPTISNEQINEAVALANSHISEKRETERNLVIQGRTLTFRLHPAESRHQFFLMTFPKAITLEGIRERLEEITTILAQRFSLNSQEVIFGLSQIDLSGTAARPLFQECVNEFRTQCQNDRYRTFDGSCNNVRNPAWGKSFICFRRLLPPRYADGISKPRVAASGRPLPRPRDLSLTIHQHRDRPARRYTMMIMSWGQFVDHDMTLTPISRTVDNGMIQCCPLQNSTHPQCLPITVRSNDPFYSRFNQQCINFVRSAMCPSCTLGPRQQTNEVTAFVDASHVYGTDLNASRALRTNSGDGKLTMRIIGRGGELLPPSNIPNTDQCSLPQENLICFRSGDVRVNQQPGLTSLHTMMGRNHNRLAEELRRLNSRWSDERLYQEARRIVGAQMQMITWSEYLPIVLGPVYSAFYDIPIPRRGYTQYDPSINPSLLNEFSTAAYRFGHSLIDTIFRTLNSSRDSSIDLRDNFFFPFELYNGLADPLLNGISNQPAQSFDPPMAPDVTNFLYRRRGNETGLDLASININRGRDHGLPGYATYVRHSFGIPISSFRDLSILMPNGIIQEFQKAYESVEDIDLFSGGLAERSVDRGIVGPTFATIIGLQFHRLKFGDRFFFSHGRQAGSFTAAQLRELKKTTLSSLICANTQVSRIQQNVFLPPSEMNPTSSCQNVPRIDLSAWRE